MCLKKTSLKMIGLMVIDKEDRDLGVGINGMMMKIQNLVTVEYDQ